jgi:phage shock protein A
MDLHPDLLDMYTREQPSPEQTIESYVRQCERSLQDVARSRASLIEQLKKCDAADAALAAQLTKWRDVLAKVEEPGALVTY